MTDNRDQDRDPLGAGGETSSPYDTEPAETNMPDFREPEVPAAPHGAEDERYGVIPDRAEPAGSAPAGELDEDFFARRELDDGDDVPEPQAAPGSVPATELPATEAPADAGEEDADSPLTRPLPEEPYAPSRADETAPEQPVADGPAAPEDDLDNTMVRRTSLWNAEDDGAQTTTVPVGAAAAVPADRTERRDYDEDILAGEELEAPRSRAGSHVLSIIGVLLLTPIAWYLLSDAGARFTIADNPPWSTGVVNLAAIAEFVGGLVVAVIIAALVRASSVGAWVTGALLTVVGATFIVVPSLVQDLLDGPLQGLADLHPMGANAAHHLVADGSTGRIALFGVVLLLGGFISHSARRAGRREERLRAAYERRGTAA